MTHSFRYHIFNALGAGVPCRRPFDSIKLLQLIGRHQVDQVKELADEDDILYRLHDNGDCLIDQGNENDDALMSFMDDSNLKKELEDVVKDADEEHVVNLSEEVKASVEAGFPNVFLKDFDVLEQRTKFSPASIIEMKEGGMEVTELTIGDEEGKSDSRKKVDMSWRVTIAKGRIRMRSVSHQSLKKFLRSPDLNLDSKRHMGLVTAIYFISGGLIFEGDANEHSNTGVDRQGTMVPFDFDDIAEGWHYSVADTGTVVVKENNPAEWIVAVEYVDVALEKEDIVFQRRQMLPVDPPASFEEDLAVDAQTMSR